MAGHSQEAEQSTTSQKVIVSHDVVQNRGLLEKMAAIIFTSDPNNIRVEVSKTLLAGMPKIQSTITNHIALQTYLQDPITENNHEFIFLSQTNTRSRLQLTSDMFCTLCHSRSIRPNFIGIVVAFGFKSANKDEYFTTCSTYRHFDRMKPFRSSQITSYDISFNVRHVEEHGRSGMSDPWSIRQTALYQHYDLTCTKSTSLLIQCPSKVKRNLELCLDDDPGTIPHSPLAVPVFLFEACSKNWRWYLNYHSDCLRQIKDDVTWARINTMPSSKASFSFDQNQSLEVLRWKLREVCAILKSQLEVGNTILKLAKDITNSIATYCPEASQDHEATKDEIRQCLAELRVHHRKACDLLDAIASIDALIAKLLDLRNFELSHGNAVALKEIAQISAAEKQLMVQIAKLAGRDSRTMKITSFIAVVFLPATLVSSIFSTDLLSGLSSHESSASRLVWLYVVLTTVLTGVTIAAVYFWDRKVNRLNHVRTSP